MFNWSDWLEKWGMTSLSINAGILSMTWQPKDPDRLAAWDLYVELLTRVSTQYLEPDDGDENTALRSIYNLFDLTRETLKRHQGCIEFARIAIVVLNQIVRPFTAKWHKQSIENAFSCKSECEAFRDELSSLQERLRCYTAMLAEMAGVEDLTQLES